MSSMPTPAPTTRRPAAPNRPYDPSFGLQEKVASLLTPIFKAEDTDDLFAYQVACRSLEAYEPETRVDFVNAGRTIAFSLAAIALLGEAADPAMPLKDRMRIVVHANALNRSADQAERSMMDRRRYQRAYPTFPATQNAAPAPEPSEAQIQTQTAEPVATPSPARGDRPKPLKPEINLEPPPVPTSAIHYSGPDRASTPPNRPDPLITPAMIQAVIQSGPSPNPM